MSDGKAWENKFQISDFKFQMPWFSGVLPEIRNRLKGETLNNVLKYMIVLFAAMVLLAACGDNKPKPKLPVGDKIEDIPNYVMQGFKLRSTEKGGIEWEMEAKGAQVFEIKNKAYAQEFKMRTFDKSGAISVLTGDRAVIDTNTNFLEATGNVRLKSDNGMLLITDKLFWDDVKKLAYSEAPVTVIKGSTVLKGVGFESDMYMRNLKIHSRVKLKAGDIGSE
jgi:LPS export ABC transporter protein LptC